MTDPVARFYDALAPDYRRIFKNWDEALDHQGAVLTALLAARGIVPPMRLYDAACGIGTQALPLAKAGFAVTAADLSAAAITEAEQAARDRGLGLAFEVADMRVAAPQHDGAFDAVIAFDNAIAHLAPGADLESALGAMADKLRPGGLLALSLRDYDALRGERPRLQAPRVHEGSGGRPGERNVTLQLWDWSDDGATYDLQHFILVEETGTWRLAHQTARLHAHPRATVEQAAEAIGLTDRAWVMPDDSGYYQPVFLARRGTD